MGNTFKLVKNEISHVTLCVKPGEFFHTILNVFPTQVGVNSYELSRKVVSMICLKIEKISFTVGYSFYQFKHILPEIQMFLQRSHSDKISGFTVSSPPHKLAITGS